MATNQAREKEMLVDRVSVSLESVYLLFCFEFKHISILLFKNIKIKFYKKK